MKKSYIFMGMLLAVMVTACSKSKKDPEPTPPTTDKPSAFDLIRDSVFLHAKESYLWFDALPDSATFKPRSFTGASELDALRKEVDAISQYKKNPATGLPFEYYEPQPGSSKYSFIDDGSATGGLEGRAGDFGMEPRYAGDRNLYIKYVYKNSPAAAKGIQRGYQVVKLNGRTDFDPTKDATIEAIVDGFYYNNTISLTLKRPDGSLLETSVNSGEYTINPVLAYKVITAGSKKVGYLVFNSFTSLAGNAKSKIDEAFAFFEENNVTDLVIDLRYNGGGYSDTQAYLCNKIVPSGKSGSLMESTIFNSKLQAGNFPLLNKALFGNRLAPTAFKVENNREYFAKKGTISPSKVAFIVTGSTASASEIAINNLMPHVDAHVFGELSYGKPVGFYAIPIGKYELRVVQAETANSLNKADFYAGIQPGSSNFPGAEVDDDVTRDFGDTEELCLAASLNYITGGTFSGVSSHSRKVNSSRLLSINQLRAYGLKIEKPGFKGMIMNNPLKK